jgi:hypothetical protein
MLKTLTPEFISCRINISNSGYQGSEIQWDDLKLSKDGAYTGTKASAQSKLAQIYQANYVGRYFGPRGSIL